jgi:mannose-1-phosphate guanylyltransferase
MAWRLLLCLAQYGPGGASSVIAQVRPLRPEYAAASLRHLWGVVLPGAGRPQAIAPSRRHYTGGRDQRTAGCDRPGTLARPLECANHLIPGSRLMTVLTREADATAGDDLAAVPGLHRCLQPASQGTAPEVFLAALSVVQQDPHAVVAMLPADHLVEHGHRLMQYVARAAAAAMIRPDLPVLVGAYPGSRDPEYAWMEPGEPLDGLEAYAVRAVRRIVARPSAAERDAGLLGMLAVVVSARTLIALGRRYLPDVLECLEPLEDVVGRPEETLLRDAVWESMPRASLCRDLLVRVEPLALVAMPDAMTGEWVRPEAQALAS